MKDGKISGTGNSWALKSVPNARLLYPTYEKLLDALDTGQFFVDFLRNAPGWEEEGDLLGKETLLKDATAALYGLGADAVPDDVLKMLAPLLSSGYKKASFSATGTDMEVSRLGKPPGSMCLIYGEGIIDGQWKVMLDVFIAPATNIRSPVLRISSVLNSPGSVEYSGNVYTGTANGFKINPTYYPSGLYYYIIF